MGMMMMMMMMSKGDIAMLSRSIGRKGGII